MIRLVLLLAALAFLPAQAQIERTFRTACTLPVTALAAAPAARSEAPVVADCAPGTEGARFEVEYIGFPANAQAAFEAAVDTWACRIRSDQPIRVRATWSSLEASTLGSAGPFLIRNFEDAPVRDVWYPSALADALAGRDLGDDDPDIDAFFNSDFPDWHLGLGAPPEGLYDLYTVVLHELAHGLGFIGNITVDDGLGFVGREPEGAFSYDLHTTDDALRPLLDASRYPDGSVALADALGEPMRFIGRALQQSVGGAVSLHAPPIFVPGGSYSHLDELVFEPGTADGLMTPFVGRAERIDAPGTVVCAMIADVGWDLAGDCAARVGPLTPVEGGVTAEQRRANPFRTSTVLRLQAADVASLRLSLVDVLGRRVQTLGTALLVGGIPLDVTVRADGLASGVYFFVAEGGGETVTVPLTVLR